VEDCSAGLSVQSDGEHFSSANVVDQDGYHNNSMSLLTVASQCETNSTAIDLERTVSPFNDEVSPKTYQSLVKEVRDNFDFYPGPASSPMDSFDECLSYGSSNRFPSVPSGSGYVSGESQGEQLQLTAVANPLPSPASVSVPSPALSTPPSLVEQHVSLDTGEVTVTFNSHTAASVCRNWYGALMQVVPEVLKPQPVARKELMTINLPDDGKDVYSMCLVV